MVRFCNSIKTNHKTNELQLNQKTINKEFIERVFSLAVDLNLHKKYHLLNALFFCGFMDYFPQNR